MRSWGTIQPTGMVHRVVFGIADSDSVLHQGDHHVSRMPLRILLSASEDSVKEQDKPEPHQHSERYFGMNFSDDLFNHRQCLHTRQR
jgi:hypothetical protein